MQTIEVKPGKKASFSINLSNNKRSEDTAPCPVKIEILDFKVLDRGQLSFGPEYKHQRSAAGWISTDSNQIVLMPGESKEVQFTVNAPIDADGDYWAAAMISIGDANKDEKGVKVKFRTASGIFIRVARRTYNERGTITDINVGMPVFDTAPVKENISETEKYRLKEKQALKIEAKLQNEGLVEILARGKALIYNEDWKRVATIPLYSSRRQVLPGDSRWFTGIMSEPLPAGNYKVRINFSPDVKFRRKITKDFEFTISSDLANIWAKNASDDSRTPKLAFEPQQINLKLNPGRFTTANLQIKNQSMNTVYANCKVENNPNPWFELKNSDFTLAPNSQSSIGCTVRVPMDAKPGIYNWTILFEMEKSGLENSSSDSVKYKVPVSITIDENSRIISMN